MKANFYDIKTPLPGVLRLRNGRLVLDGDKTGRKTKAYLLAFAKRAKLTDATPIAICRTDGLERLRNEAFIARNWGA